MVPGYKDFVKDQVAYAREMEKIKYMTFEQEELRCKAVSPGGWMS